jgi:hypothetical protein
MSVFAACAAPVVGYTFQVGWNVASHAVCSCCLLGGAVLGFKPQISAFLQSLSEL